MNVHITPLVYENELLPLIRTFYPDEQIEKSTYEQSSYRITVSDLMGKVAYFGDGQEALEVIEVVSKGNEKDFKRVLKTTLYDLCHKLTKKDIHWGILTGIRPTKLAFKLLKQTESLSEVQRILVETYRLSPKKAELLMSVVKVEEPYMQVEPDSYSVYIGIPFCPSKCSYCTFPSYQADKWPEAYAAYTDALLMELEAGQHWLKGCDSIYIGGGTPTSLTDEDFDRLMYKIRSYIGDRDLEFTVEAGRPDSITPSKLETMRACGVNRISINPQTMEDRTLKRLGRHHDSAAIIDCFEMARDESFNHINMDLILGLPGEDTEDVRRTLDKVLELDPESITVHTLAYKRGSKLTETMEMAEYTVDIQTSLSYVEAQMAKHHYHPYYLYRQKQMVGNFENVGYCKKGHESVYNIRIMEEVQSIVAFGAGAISKKVTAEGIERLEQPKDVTTYLNNLKKNIRKKAAFFL